MAYKGAIQRGNRVNILPKKSLLLKQYFKPGFWIKPSPALTVLDSNYNLNLIYDELQAASPCFLGFKVSQTWGKIESRNAQGVATFNWDFIDYHLDRLSAMGKYMIFMMPFKNFDGSTGVEGLLPNDLNTSYGTYDAGPPNGTIPISHNYWTYENSPQQDNLEAKPFGYNLALQNPEIINRLNYFFSKLAARYDKHPNFIEITTNESASGVSLDPNLATPISDHEAGIAQMMYVMKNNFKSTMVTADINYSRTFVADIIPEMISRGIGFGTSNSNLGFGLNRTTPIAAPGVLTYYPFTSDKIYNIPEIQGADIRSTTGDDNSKDWPSPAVLVHNVMRLKPNSVVWQRLASARVDTVASASQNNPWLGGGSRQQQPIAIYDWMNANVDANMNIHIVDAAAGLNYTTNLNKKAPAKY